LPYKGITLDHLDGFDDLIAVGGFVDLGQNLTLCGLDFDPVTQECVFAVRVLDPLTPDLRQRRSGSLAFLCPSAEVWSARQAKIFGRRRSLAAGVFTVVLNTVKEHIW
jgi:hypothetical protein